MAQTHFLKNLLLDHCYRSTPYTPPATYYLALFVTPTTNAGGGTEVTGGGYSRVPIPRADGAWQGTHGSASGASSGTSGIIANVARAQFGNPTGDWGECSHVAVMDALTGGNMLEHAAMVSPKTVLAGGAAPFFEAGELKIGIGG